MTGVVAADPVAGGQTWSGDPRSAVPRYLTFCLVSVFLFPADMVLGPVGAVGYVAMLVAIVTFGIWIATAVFGLHNPAQLPSPARLGLGMLWLVSILAYITAPQEFASATQRAAADRWILTLAGISGIVLSMNESLRSWGQIARAIRALSVGAALCAMVAIYQFSTFQDPMDYVRSVMVGFTENGGNTPFQQRAPFVRVAGSTFHPIELGVVSAMILPFSVWRSIYDTGVRRRWVLWLQTALIAFASIVTVSRSAILALTVVVVIFIPTLPRVQRQWALVVTPACAAMVFLVLPGFLSTIADAFGAGTSDPSLATRVNNYPRVEALISAHPFTGIGPGAYAPTNALEILDNQYLTLGITMGLVGVFGLLMFFGLPIISSVQVIVLTKDPQLRCLAGAVAASGAVAAVTSGTFDSFSFPVFVVIDAAVVGFATVVWKLAKVGASSAASPLVT